VRREALLYEKLSRQRVRCHVCPRRCAIGEGKAGWCRKRENEDGVLYTLIYGAVSSASVNPIEKKPVFHFLPGSRWLSLGSLGCNFRCPGCQNWEIAHWKGGEARGTSYLSPEDSVALALERGCLGLSWTFNEPALWLEYTLEGARQAKARGLYANYVTNGYITEEAFDLLAPHLDVYRVDIKGFYPETYQRVANISDPQGIRRMCERARERSIHLELVTNVIPGYNDDEGELTAIAHWIRERLGADAPWHLTRFYPQSELSHLRPTPIPALERARRLALDVGLHYVYLGNVPGHPAENTCCAGCGALLIGRDVFEIRANRIREGRCPYCGAAIPGRF
jgi:pyruvate formate lyase activating enzyme